MLSYFMQRLEAWVPAFAGMTEKQYYKFMPKKKKYYAYFIPSTKKHGVTDDWATCERMVKGVMGARYRSFNDKTDAERWLKGGALYDAKPARDYKKLEAGIYFDAGTGRGDGVEISVTDETGHNLLHKAFSKTELNKFGKHLIGNPSATNNYGELLALRSALEIATKENSKKIFGDSKLVIEYWSRGRIRTRSQNRPANIAGNFRARDEISREGIPESPDEGISTRSRKWPQDSLIIPSAILGTGSRAKELSEETVALAHEVANMRKLFEEKGGTIERISGAVNPADLGFHR